MAEPPTPPRCTVCKEGLVKPDIVFFGEGLPQRFFKVTFPPSFFLVSSLLLYFSYIGLFYGLFLPRHLVYSFHAQLHTPFLTFYDCTTFRLVRIG